MFRRVGFEFTGCIEFTHPRKSMSEEQRQLEVVQDGAVTIVRVKAEAGTMRAFTVKPASPNSDSSSCSGGWRRCISVNARGANW